MKTFKRIFSRKKAKGESSIITPASETVNVEAVNVEGNAEGTSTNTKQKSVATAKDTSAQIIEGLDSLHLETPPETVDSLRAYEKDTDEAQRFLDRMGNDFRWPTSMPQNTRDQVFWVFTDIDVTEDDKEYALNCIYFYNSLDKGMFDEHKQDWVLVYKQSVVEYGEKKSNKQRSDLDREMPGALYLPVDSLLREEFLNPKIPAARAVLSQRSADGGEYMIQARVKRVGDENTNFITLAYRFNDTKNRNKLYKTVIDTGAPETILPYEVRSYLGTAGWERQAVVAPGYGAPAKLFLATGMIIIGADGSRPIRFGCGNERPVTRWILPLSGMMYWTNLLMSTGVEEDFFS
ncbi:10748_t:CDS:2 [Funneliformis mosseae]|uniref:10748_t:CDS:1 n=1 Tax=Funneliformis mosseae TaxID=27381 RepID=A0A9N8V2P1_FUNMO|nr:10748_t:CDS:2 [Funneliformis mosseae]